MEAIRLIRQCAVYVGEKSQVGELVNDQHGVYRWMNVDLS